MLQNLLVSLLLVIGSTETQPAVLPSWMGGCWELRREGTVVEEQWLFPEGGVMLGMGRTVRDGRLREYEFLLIRAASTGLSYEAHPSGQPAATFRSSQAAETMELIFENPVHHYPQRIGYRRESDDRITAWIDGTDKGVPRRIEFPYRRTSCGVSAP